MTDGHEVQSLDTHRHTARRLLTELEFAHATSQRTLARRTGVALGLTNTVLRCLMRKGLVSTVSVEGRESYVITPEGIAEKARMWTAYFAQTTRFYVEARNRIRDRLWALSEAWPPQEQPVKRVAFYGATEVGEIAHVCLHETDLVVTEIFDSGPARRFFGLPVRDEALLADPTSWCRFDMLVVMSFDGAMRQRVAAYVAQIGFPTSRVFWI